MLAVAFAWVAAPARGDGDPASDVLAVGPLFLPADAGATNAQQLELTDLLRAAQRAGEAIRVAIIASPTDLGSVTGLWRRPHLYAAFLGQELGLVYRGPLLVVMPDGMGLNGVTEVAGGRAGLAAGRLPAATGSHPSAAGRLAGSAIAEVRRLAAALGHPLALSAIAGHASRGPANPGIWVALGGGAALVGLAWGLSLRARPPRAFTRSTRSSGPQPSPR